MAGKILIVVVGPTAVGKTGLAIRLAEYFRTEIVSADSRQIYRELEIGTAKPSVGELQRVKHHFINTKSIEEDYDAGRYSEEARRVIDALFEIHDVVVLCGGSGLYVKAVLEGFDEMPDIPDGIREGIIREFKEKGIVWLQQQIARYDPDYYEAVDRKNSQRLMRALEVIQVTGKPISEFHQKKKVELPLGVLKIGLQVNRQELYDRIDRRMDEMIERGLFDEAEKFFSRRHLNALQTVGYREIFGFIENAYDREEAVRLLKRNSRHYAKRQLTWFKKDSGIHWFHPDDWGGIEKMVKEKIG